MPESRNRDLATSLGQAVKNNTITSTGSLAVVGLTAYDSAGLLPSSYDSNNAGTLGFAEDSDKLYIHTGQGWFNIAVINTTPIFTASPSGSYELATDATAYKNGTATVITLAARDSEGFPVTFSATGNSAFNNIAHVDKDSANGFIFTVEPKSADSVGENLPADGTLTFSVTDGINTASATSTFSLRFDTSVANSESTYLFATATGNNLTDQNLTGLDESDSGHSVTAITNAQLTRLSAFTPFASPGHSCMIGYDSGSGNDSTHFVKIRNNSRFAWGTPSGNTNDFTIECWVYPLDVGDVHARYILDMRGTSTSNTALSLWFQPSGMLFVQGHGGNLGGSDKYVQYNEWNHIAVVRHGNDLKLYLNGVQNGSTADVTSVDFNYTTSSGDTSDIYIGRITPASTGNTHPGSSGTTNAGRFTGYICDLRIVRGTAIYTAEFTPPTTALETVSNTITHLFKKNVPFLFGMSPHSAHTTHSYGSQFLRSGGTWPSSDTSAGSANTPMIVNHTPYKISEQWSASTHGGSLESRSRVGVAGHSDFQFGNSTPFTIELWAAFSQNTGNLEMPLIDNRTSSGIGFYIHYDDDGKIKVAYGTTSSHTDLIADTSSIGWVSSGSPFTCWTHIAYCFDGTTHRLFINGDAKTTSTTSVNYNSSGQLKIGSETNEVWIGPMRIINGTAVYGTVYNFFPPTGLFTKTGSTYFSLKDPFSGSGGNTSVNNSVPQSHTKLLINWANGNLGPYQATGNVWFNQRGESTNTSAGGVTSSTGSQKYSVPSLLFDRSAGDRINYPNNYFSEHQKAIAKSERHCFEAWVQWSGSATTHYGNNPTILVLQQTNTSTHYSSTSESDLTAKVDNGGKLRLFIGSGRLDDSSSNLVIDHHSGNILDGNWHHVAFVRNNDTVYLFVDGVQGTSTGTTNSKMYASWGGLGGTNYQRNDGSNGTPGSGGYYVYGGGWNGYMSQVRKSRGNHRYPFFPKKETLTTSTSFQNAITVTASDTKLLCCHHATATTDGSSNQTITVNGNPAVSSWAPNGGMKSIYFDGNSGNASSLTTGNTADFAWGTGNVTIEMWVYFNGGSAFTNGYPYLIDFTDGDTQGFKIYTENNQKIRFYANSTADDSDIVVATHKWYHIAAVRQSQVWYLYVNGSQDPGIALSDNINYGNTQATIGGRYDNNGYNHIGYISNVRVVKGQAIYTKDFTPPSEAMYG